MVIATHNRRHVIARAIVSALAQNGQTAPPEVVVVDDASTDGTSRYVTTAFPSVRLHRMPKNSGPGPCRNLGLRMATGRWAVVLDDDDELMPDALHTIAQRLASFPNLAEYPVFKFRRSDGTLTVPFQLSRVEDLWGGERHGNFVTVWNREVGLTEEWAYPDHRFGAESLLWIRMAARHGLPTWSDCVAIAHSDAGTRLRWLEVEPPDARDRMQIQEGFVRLLRPYESDPRVRDLITRQTFIGGVYALLAGERREALLRSRQMLARRRPRAALKLALGAIVPRALVASWFRARRDRLEGAAPPTLTGWERDVPSGRTQ